MSTVRLVSWNVRAGGRRKRPQIAHALAECGADVVAISEWLPGPDGTGRSLDEALAEAGFVHHVISPAPT